MKLFVVFFATIALSFAAPGPGNMCIAYREYQALLPVEELKNLTIDYFRNDPEVRKIILYLGDRDILVARLAFANIPEISDLYSWLSLYYSCYSDKHWEVNPFSQMSLRFSSTTTPGGWKAFVDDFLNVYPVKEVKAWAIAKLAEGGQVAQLYYRIKDLREVLYEAVHIPAIAKVINNFRLLGVDVDQIGDMIKQIFGW